MATTSLVEKVVKEVRSGIVSSVVAEAALFPLDAVKLQQQIHGGNVLHVAQSIVQQKGLGGLYQGLIGRLIQTVTSNVGFFIWQTVFRQLAFHRDGKLQENVGTIASLVVNMLAQQFNRLLTTPVDVVATVNQADPNSPGFFLTFLRLANTGGMAALWRGLGVTLLLALNPALMFTLVGKLSSLVLTLRDGGELAASDMFWISGASKAVATLLTYPLIRAKAVIQASGGSKGWISTMVQMAKQEGITGLYNGVWIMSYKTVLFNSIMMALKHKLANLLTKTPALRFSITNEDNVQETHGPWRKKVILAQCSERPWVAAARQASVMYVDGSWSQLHAAQDYLLHEAARRGDHLVVGVHSDASHFAAVGTWPTECYAARLGRLQSHPMVSSILEDAPWEVGNDLIQQLGIAKVLSGSVTKLKDCAAPSMKTTDGIAQATDKQAPSKDPYSECKKLGLFEELPSLNSSTEHDAWVKQVTRMLFSNVDASIDWRILVADGEQAPWGRNPGYADHAVSATIEAPAADAVAVKVAERVQ
mmetsp:Transcript_70252/g.139160  ORF Transcript_70252/g.139160 Transcript_70252/m.139160 type:complete len:533 (-) Transcript_70252:97-1695(-)|eukprot:CAMPEP_0172665226 /NCGR_PEP_ID=MMETSP1074-20121228/7107_1 /TAXON_ID=2916 /ORGANISM="Ceratium fusus, Strain PA161109" /LENGTH=532 /DNA_ID=CAMNT_0013481501 /DNA_START=12 /DNA_END=1610 /DNA_ORIENTATION=+